MDLAIQAEPPTSAKLARTAAVSFLARLGKAFFKTSSEQL
jgi:hypothetical protein